MEEHSEPQNRQNRQLVNLMTLDEVIDEERGTYDKKKKRGTKRKRISSQNSYRVFVDNLNFSISWQQLKDHMRQAGRVLHAEVFRSENDESLGMGFVEYENENSAQNSVSKLDGSTLEGREICVYLKAGSGKRQRANSGFSGSSNSVFVSNLNFETRWQELKDLMRTVGNVLNVDVFEDSAGNSKGSAIVEFSHPKDAIRAMTKLNGYILDGREIYVREDREADDFKERAPRKNYSRNRDDDFKERAPRNRDTSIYVGNLPWEISWQDLKDLCNEFGEVAFVDVPVDFQGRSKGYGLVRFENEEDAENAIQELDGYNLDGRELNVREDRGYNN